MSKFSSCTEIITPNISQLLGDISRAVSDRPIIGLTREEVLDLIAESNTNHTPIVGVASLAENRSPDPLNTAVVHRLETIEQQLSSAEIVGRNDVEQLIQASEQRVMEAACSLLDELRGDLTDFKLSMSRDITRWFGHLENEKFKKIVQTGISDEHSNQEIVTKLFAAGYGKNENTEPYIANLASAMKTALRIKDERNL